MSDLPVCLRVDLDYVPWDSDEFGHFEPAGTQKLLLLAQQEGWKMHFFCSLRTLSAFRSLPDAILNDGHDLDWLVESGVSLEDARRVFSEFGGEIKGCALGPPESEQFQLDFCLPAVPKTNSLGEWIRGSSEMFDNVILIRPGFLAKADPGFSHLKTLVRSALEGGRRMRTYREITSLPAS